MSDFVYVDTNTLKSRKPHTCEECKNLIEIGEKYACRTRSGKVLDHFVRDIERRHLKCEGETV